MGESPSQVVVFAGPTLPRDPDPAWRSLLAACDVRPPVQRGDVLAALAHHPRTMILLDGYYFTVPSVPHKELLYALDAGVRVIGAASLGALRAVELAPFGMIGVGTVFDWYRTGALDGDDEVALLHAPAEHGYRPVTLALVEVRHALARLQASGAAEPEAARRLIADLKALSFLDRHPARVVELARLHLGKPATGELARILATESVKQEDARQALELALDGGPAPCPRERVVSDYVSFYKEVSLRCPPAGPESARLLSAWRMAQLFHPEAPAFARQVRIRSLLVSAAAHRGLAPPPGREEEIAASLRRCHEERFGRAFLPEPEYREEARFEALAAEACRVLGGVKGALRTLAQTLELDGKDDEEALLRLLAEQLDSLPAWRFVRTFCFNPVFPAAAEAAAAAEEVHRCFRRWADGARVAWDDLRALAARLWGCEPERVEEEAARRALFPAAELSEGLREALELVIAAERLPRPINDWPAKRDALASAMSGASVFAWEDTPRPRLRPAAKEL
ncbi:MAG TPA: TfuA domain-containing protein [Thermoanaerobaculia bacterium]|nr:TfuA domain-containing protein [Thermoanaerobaculia bacterium]